MKLYEINEQLRNIIDTGKYLVDTETGEKFTPDELNALEIARDDKIEGVAIVIKEKLAEAEAIKVEIANLTQRQKSLTNSATWLKDYLKEQLAGATFESPKAKISYRNSKAVVFTDWSLVPSQYFKPYERKESDISKTEIKKALDSGVEIPGAVLEERKSLVLK